MFFPDADSQFAQLHEAADLAHEAHDVARRVGDVETAERAIDVMDAIYSELYPAPLEPSASEIVQRIARYTNGGR